MVTEVFMNGATLSDFPGGSRSETRARHLHDPLAACKHEPLARDASRRASLQRNCVVLVILIFAVPPLGAGEKCSAAHVPCVDVLFDHQQRCNWRVGWHLASFRAVLMVDVRLGPE